MGHEMADQHDGAAPSASRALVAILLGVTGGAWLLTARLATPDMRRGVLTGAAMMPTRGRMGMPDSMSMGPGAFIATWTVMMVAMMVPSLVPIVRAFDTEVRTAGRTSGATTLFVVGYLLAWSAIGGVAYPVLHGLTDWLPVGSTTTLRVGAALLVVAGVYHLTPLQRTCLRRCQSPAAKLAPLVGMRAEGRRGALRAGLGQGVACLGACWPLMLVLLLVGMMDLAWMGVVAGVIVVEKVVPGGDTRSAALGCARGDAGR